jgi:hypothetical protein
VLVSRLVNTSVTHLALLSISLWGYGVGHGPSPSIGQCLQCNQYQSCGREFVSRVGRLQKRLSPLARSDLLYPSVISRCHIYTLFVERSLSYSISNSTKIVIYENLLKESQKMSNDFSISYTSIYISH